MKSVLREISTKVEITALSTDPEQTRAICGVNAERLLCPWEYPLRATEYDRVFSRVDAILVTGGTPFYDYDHLSRFIHMRLARRGVPFACFGVGVKRINSPPGRWLTRWLLSDARRVSVRDVISRKRIENITGRPVSLTGDSAFFVEPAPNGAVYALFEKIGIERGEDLAVICPRALSASNRAHYHDPLSEEQIEFIRMGVARTADKLSEAGYTVIFLPMHSASNDDDLVEIRIVRRSMKLPSWIVGGTLDPHIVASFLGSASIVVGLRLHSLILAASRGVPIVSVGYDEKIRGFMEYAGVGDCVSEPTDLTGKALAVVARGDKVGARLNESCSSMRARIREEASVIMESLC